MREQLLSRSWLYYWRSVLNQDIQNIWPRGSRKKSLYNYPSPQQWYIFLFSQCQSHWPYQHLSYLSLLPCCLMSLCFALWRKGRVSYAHVLPINASHLSFMFILNLNNPKFVELASPKIGHEKCFSRFLSGIPLLAFRKIIYFSSQSYFQIF